MCKVETKTRLRSNYSYYRILIVEDAQPIVNMTLLVSHRESSYVIGNDVRWRHYESFIIQHCITMSHRE